MEGGPRFCRKEAFEEFQKHILNLDSTEGLFGATVAVSMHALDDIQPEDVIAQVDSLADRVLSRVRTPSFDAYWTRLHEVMFDEEGFRGNTEHYYSPLNSYFSAILASKRGLPIALSLLYKAVAERVGLAVQGINSPGHFLVSIQNYDSGRRVLVDPFFGGQILTDEEAKSRIQDMVGTTEIELLPEASHVDWLLRILRNLERIFQVNHHEDDCFAMRELVGELIRCARSSDS